MRQTLPQSSAGVERAPSALAGPRGEGGPPANNTEAKQILMQIKKKYLRKLNSGEYKPLASHLMGCCSLSAAPAVVRRFCCCWAAATKLELKKNCEAQLPLIYSKLRR